MSIAAGEVDETTVVAQGPHVGTVDVGDRVVLVDEATGRGWALNPTGALIWRLYDGASPLGELVDDLTDVLGGPRGEVAASVVGLTSFLGDVGLLDGVLRSIFSVPIDVQYVDVDELGNIVQDSASTTPSFDSRYLAAPPNR